MKHVERAFIFGVAIAISALALGPAALLAQSDQNGGRVPNMDDKQMYPRWLPAIEVDAVIGPSSATTTDVLGRIQFPSIAVDSHNIVHIAGVASSQVPFPPAAGTMYYYNNAWAGDSSGQKQGSGFSRATTIPLPATADSIGVFALGMAVGSNDDVHVVYQLTDFTVSVTDLYYTRRSASTQTWTSPVNITNGTGNQSYFVSVGSVAVDAGGVARVVSSFIDTSVNPAVQYLVHVTSTGTKTVIPGTDGNSTSPQIAINSSGVSYIAWIQSTPTTSSAVFEAFPGSPVILESDPAGIFSIGVAADPSNGNVHFAWQNSTRARYARTGGSVESVSTQPVAGGRGAVRIAVDSLHQPHVVWYSNAGTYPAMAYAGRINNPTISSSDPWAGRQEPTEGGSLGWRTECQPLQMAIGKTNTLYVAGVSPSYAPDGVFTRSIEFNLGEQDSFALEAVGPRAAVNQVNGNLLVNVPLFSSRGAGVSTSLALLYNSQEPHPGALSEGWIYNYQMYLLDCQQGWKDQINSHGAGQTGPNSDVITLFMGDGRSVVFKWDATSGVHLAQNDFGYFSSLARDEGSPAFAGTYTLTTKFGVQYKFGPDGKLFRVLDTNQNSLALNYSSGLLASIVDSMGRGTTFTYLSTNQLDVITDPGGKKYKCTYGTGSRLVGINLNQGGPSNESPLWQFAYGPIPNFMSGTTTPRGFATSYNFYPDGRFQMSMDPTVSPASVDESDPGTPSITQNPPRVLNYFDPGNPSSPPANEPRTEFTNRRSFVTKVVTEQRRCLVDGAIDALGKTLGRSFDGTYRNLKSFVDKEGNTTNYTYTYEAGTKESPLYVKDNLRSVTSPSANAASGSAGATVVTAEYTFYDGFSRIQTAVTPNPASAGGTVTTTFAYDGNQNLTFITYPPTSNRVTGVAQTIQEQIFYVSSAPLGRIDHSIAPEGGITQYQYTDFTTGLPTSIQRPARTKAESFTYDNMGNLLTDQLPENAGNPTTYIPDGLYRIHQIQAPPGDSGNAMTTYTYDLESNVVQVDFPNGGRTVNTFDPLGRLVQMDTLQTPVITLTFTRNYDPEGNARLATDPLLNTSSTLYDARNDVVKDNVVVAPSPNLIATYAPTDNGDVQTQTINGDITTFAYTARRQILSTAYPAAGGGTATDNEAYDEVGNHVKSTRYFGGSFKFGTFTKIDEAGRRTGSVELTADGATPSGPNVLFGLDRDGNRTQLQDPNSRIFSSTFDLGDRLTSTVNSGGTTVSKFIYDDNDRRIEIDVLDPVSGAGLIVAQTMTYSFRNELKTQKDIFNNTSTYTYLIGGELDTRTDPLNIVTKYQYNLLSQTTQVSEDFAGTPIVTLVDYDGDGNLKTITDPRGKIYSYLFDAAHRMTRLTYPGTAGNFEAWTYDAKGRLATHTDHRGVVATMAYDAMDRLTSELYQFGTMTLANILRSYDGASNVTETLDTISMVSHRNEKSDGTPGYDALNRLTDLRILFGVTALGGAGTLWKSENYTYNPDSTRLTFTNSEGQVFTYGYDAEGRPQTITRTSPAPSKVYITYAYDGVGRPTMTMLGNGATITRMYDSKGRVSNITAKTSGGATLASFSYTVYSARDERKTLVYGHLGTTANFAYDSFGRLNSESWSGGSVGAYAASYGYDNAGNRTTKTVGSTVTTCAYDDENRITTETTGTTVTTYDYTYNGIAGKSPDVQKRSTGKSSETFTYDYAHRLTGYVAASGKKTSADHSYNFLPTGPRLNKVNNAAKHSALNEEWYFPDGADVAVDYVKATKSTTYTLSSTYVNGAGIDSKATRIQASGTELYYIGDALGSVHKIIDQNQVVQDTELTTAWGEPHPGFTDQIAIPDRYGFSQREKDAESATMQFRARNYDPRTGRFLQTDPIIGNRPMTHYTYASNNPVTHVDLMGLQDKKDDSLEDKARRWAGYTQSMPWRSLSNDNQGELLPLGDELLTKIFDGDFAKWREANAIEYQYAEAPKTFAQRLSEYRAAGFKIEQRGGQTFIAIPAEFKDPTSPEGWKIVQSRFPEVVDVVTGIDIKNPSLLDVLMVLPGGKLGKLAKVFKEAEEVGAFARRAAKVEKELNYAKGLSKVKPSAEEIGKAAAKATERALNYREVFFEAYPHLKGNVWVHHAIEQNNIMKYYPGLFSWEELQKLENLRGIPKEVNAEVHLSKIRISWNEFYTTHSNATREQVLQKVAEIDKKFGSQFLPPR